MGEAESIAELLWKILFAKSYRLIDKRNDPRIVFSSSMAKLFILSSSQL